MRAGDNLWDLTDLHLTSPRFVQPLQRLNGVRDPYRIPPGTQLRIPLAWLKLRQATAQVEHVEGAGAQLVAGNATTPLSHGQILHSGDSLSTDKRSSVLIRFEDGSQLLVQAESVVILKKLQAYGVTGMVDTRIDVRKGRIESDVKRALGAGSRFDISTPTAVTAVRGTDFRVGAGDDISRTEVLAGKVSVAAERRAIGVEPGFGTVVAAGAAPLPPIRLLPPPDLSLFPSVIERVPLNVPFAPRDNAASYRVQIARAPSSGTFAIDEISAAPAVRGFDLADGDYQLRIRTVDAQGLEGPNIERSFHLNARPEPPALISPAPQAPVAEEHPLFSWALPTNLSGLRLQVASDAAFTHTVFDQEIAVAATFSLPVPLALGEYHWRVAAILEVEGMGPFSDGQPFRRVAPGPAAEAPEVGDKEITLQWRAGLPGQQFRVQLAEAEDFASTVVDSQVGENSIAVERPQGGRYYLRIMTIDADGYEGVWGSPQAIEIPQRRNWWWLLLIPLLPLAL